ncbi:MAG: helix-turn-helix domain-containing protein [Deltaproteobacteria bacterium]|nr:helix-turn-helix domain-containing protein [Deltaproteobacteria bacterium]
MNRERKNPNKLREVREDLMISKAELARRAGVSALTIDRIESGENCRVDTKRKIILALGLKLNEKDKVFVNETQAHEKERRRS